jgi:hypothetical protein
MNALRIVLGILAVIPLTLLADKLFFHVTEYDDYSLRTLIYYAIGVPIAVLNIWVWAIPETIRDLFMKR